MAQELISTEQQSAELILADTISLDSLIDEHKKRISQIKYKPSPPNVIGRGYHYYDDNIGYKKWLAITKRVLGCTFPHDRDIDEFEIVSKKTLSKSQQEELLAILEAFRNVPDVITGNKTIQYEEKNRKGKDVHVTNTIYNAQSQNQSQTVQIFFEAIKDELTGKQQKELKSIVDEDLEPETKRTKIIDKIKSFGIDTLSNIVANIATNPAVWG